MDHPVRARTSKETARGRITSIQSTCTRTDESYAMCYRERAGVPKVDTVGATQRVRLATLSTAIEVDQARELD